MTQPPGILRVSGYGFTHHNPGVTRMKVKVVEVLVTRLPSVRGIPEGTSTAYIVQDEKNRLFRAVPWNPDAPRLEVGDESTMGDGDNADLRTNAHHLYWIG